MNHAALLPIAEGQTFSGWAEGFVEEIAPLVQSIVKDDDVAALRDRNEKLSAYLATLTIIRSRYYAQIVTLKHEFAAANPPPDKGIKAWEAAADAALGDTKITYDLITELYDVISKRISVTQTNLRSRSAEVTSLGG